MATHAQIGILTLEIHLPQSASLKQKRAVIKSLKDRLAQHFNVSVAEIDYLDKWQRAVLALVMVANDRVYLETKFEAMRRFVDNELLGKGFVTAQEFKLL